MNPASDGRTTPRGCFDAAAEARRKQATVAAVTSFRDAFFSFLSSNRELAVDEQLLSSFSDMWIAIDDLAQHHEQLAARLADCLLADGGGKKKKTKRAKMRAKLKLSSRKTKPGEIDTGDDDDDDDDDSDADQQHTSEEDDSQSSRRRTTTAAPKKTKFASTTDLHAKKNKRPHGVGATKKRVVTDSSLYERQQRSVSFVVDMTSPRSELAAAARTALLQRTQLIFDKHYSQLPIEKDLPRLLRNITINGIAIDDWTCLLADADSSLLARSQSSPAGLHVIPAALSISQSPSFTQLLFDHSVDRSTTGQQSIDTQSNQTAHQSNQSTTIQSNQSTIQPFIDQSIDQTITDQSNRTADQTIQSNQPTTQPFIDQSFDQTITDQSNQTADQTTTQPFIDQTIDETNSQSGQLSLSSSHLSLVSQAAGSDSFVDGDSTTATEADSSAVSVDETLSSTCDERSTSDDLSTISERSERLGRWGRISLSECRRRVDTALDLSRLPSSPSSSSSSSSSSLAVSTAPPSPRSSSSTIDPQTAHQLVSFFTELCVSLGLPAEQCKRVAASRLLDDVGSGGQKEDGVLLLDSAIRTYIANVLDSSAIVIAALKLMTQSIVAPIIVALKEAMMLLPFNSVPSSWRVELSVARSEVTVRHLKFESSAPHAVDRFAAFSFAWTIVYTLDRDTAQLTGVSTSLLRFNCDPAVSLASRLALEEILRDLIEIGLMPDQQTELKQRIQQLVADEQHHSRTRRRSKSRESRLKARISSIS